MLVDSSSVSLFLQLLHQAQSVYFLPLLHNDHVWFYRPEIEQVECLVQLQHCWTCLQAWLTGILTVEIVPLSPVGFFYFLFNPPNGRAAVDHDSFTPSISWPSCVQSYIKDRNLHQEITGHTQPPGVGNPRATSLLHRPGSM